MKHPFVLVFSLLIMLAPVLGCSGPDTKSDETPVRRTNAVAAQEYYIKGNTKLDAGDYKGAVKEYKRALKRHKERWEIHMNMGVAYSRDGNFEDALNEMETALRSGGDKELVCLFNLGNVYQERGMYSQAIDAYRAALAIEPKNPDVDTLINLGAAYLFLYRYDDARQTYQHTASLAPDDPRPIHGQALVLQAQNKYQEAYDMYERAHMIDPNFSMSYMNKSWVLAALNRYPEAIQSLETYISKDPNGPYVRRAKKMLEVYKRRLEKQS